ncbi:hypothetical protein ABT214_22250 [Micromonospora purpureochromogenes]|uniref:hypothetical protein n=1 Tax=Micromonospora purpureochromogenes TaxID=47872 RepID=UPI003321F636
MVRYRYTPEALAEAAAAAHSIAGVMRLLGVRISGGSHAHISRQLKRFGIDTSHFTGSAHNKGRRGERRTPTDVPSTPPRLPAPLAPDAVADLIRQVEAGVLRPVDAARSIGCHRNHLPRLRRRLAATGTVTPAPRQASGPAPRSTDHETVVRYALANPALGPRKLAGLIRESSGGECVVSHGTVSNILRRAGLHTVSARRSKLSGSAGVAERQTRGP